MMNKSKRYFLIVCCLVVLAFRGAYGQNKDTAIFLTANPVIQLESIEALNDLYNADFEKAEQQFRWLMQKYRWHPLPHFLLGLSQWWKMMPYDKKDQFDTSFLAYMDTSIVVAENLYEHHPTYQLEATFFLAAAHGFKGYFYAEDLKEHWGKAIKHGKLAIKYMNMCSEQNYLSPELLFGDALYNYFSVWIPENYPALKVVLWFFKKGDKALGLQQLNEVTSNAFYTRIEAMMWMMRIQSSFENNHSEAFRLADYLHERFPNNPYFHRYYIRMLFTTGKTKLLEPECLFLIDKIDQQAFGYEYTTGRYAAFYLGEIFHHRGQLEEAKKYYLKAVEYANKNEAITSGYYHHSLISLGEICAKNKDMKGARRYFKQVKKLAKRKDGSFKEAKRKLKELEKGD